MEREKLEGIVKDFLKKSRNDENLVMSLLEASIGGKCYQASSSDDKYKHIDIYWITPKNIKVGIDVKGRHKSKRSDRHYDDSIQWLELKNVHGNDGWLKGQADYIAFCLSDKVVFCKRQKLLAHTLKMIEGREMVTETPKECYTPYKRSKYERDDVVIKAPMSDIEKIADFEIKTTK